MPYDWTNVVSSKNVYHTDKHPGSKERGEIHSTINKRRAKTSTDFGLYQ
jgi:hypothetical protein